MSGWRPAPPPLCLLALAWALGCGGCGKASTRPSAARNPAPSPPAATASPKADPWAAPRFCLAALQLTQATPPQRRLPQLEVDEAVARDALARIEVLQVDTAACRERPLAEQVGVALTLDYAGSGPKLVRPDRAAEGATLIVSAVAHVERGGPKGKPEVGRATVDAAGPLVRAAPASLRRRVRARLVRAATLATQRALGQLWALHQPEATLLAVVKRGDPWQRAAALQEVGERGLVGSVDAVERACASSLADVAQVAAAALGRLGQARSVPVLIGLLRTAPPEVADAALFALHEIGGAPARAAIAQAAKSHASAWIRLRAGALLDAGSSQP